MARVGTTEAFAIYDAACIAEDSDTATDFESERRWHAGRDAFRATVETPTDALILMTRLYVAGDVSLEAATFLSDIVQRGVTSSDLPALRQHIAGLCEAALIDDTDEFWMDHLIDGMAALSAFLFQPRLIPVIA